MENSEYCDWIKCIFSLQMSNSSTQGSPGDLKLKPVFLAHDPLVIGTVIVVIVIVIIIILTLLKVIFKRRNRPEATEEGPPDSPTPFYTPPSSPDPWLVPMVPMAANTAPSAPTPPPPPPNPGPWILPVPVVTLQ